MCFWYLFFLIYLYTKTECARITSRCWIDFVPSIKTKITFFRNLSFHFPSKLFFVTRWFVFNFFFALRITLSCVCEFAAPILVPMGIRLQTMWFIRLQRRGIPPIPPLNDMLRELRCSRYRVCTCSMIYRTLTSKRASNTAENLHWDSLVPEKTKSRDNRRTAQAGSP